MSDVPSSAMIFAAGFGTRMGSLTKSTPKPMLEVSGRPMIDHSVNFLREANIQKIVANTHYLHDTIAPHLKALGVEISHEQREILDTGGGLRAALPLLGDGPIVTMNPDAAWRGQNPVETLLSHWSSEFDALLLVVPVERAVERLAPGDFALANGSLQRQGDYVYTGLQIIRPSLLEPITDRVFSLNRVWDTLIERDALRGVVYDGDWCDIGHPQGLDAAETLMSMSDV